MELDNLEVMTVDEVAKFLKVPKNTLNSWLSTGTIPRDEVSFKIGARRLFCKEKIIKFIEEKMKSSN